MVDVAAQKISAETDARDTSAKTDGDEPEGFPGGPRDLSVLTKYVDHVAGNVWSGKVFIILILVTCKLYFMIEISFPLNDNFNEFCVPLYFNSGAS